MEEKIIKLRDVRFKLCDVFHKDDFKNYIMFIEPEITKNELIGFNRFMSDYTHKNPKVKIRYNKDDCLFSETIIDNIKSTLNIVFFNEIND